MNEQLPKRLCSCKNCVHYEKRCKEKHASWYPQRGYGPCPHWVLAPLTDEDY